MLPWLRRILRNDMRIHGLFEEALDDAEAEIDDIVAEVSVAAEKAAAEVDDLKEQLDDQEAMTERARAEVDDLKKQVEALTEQVQKLAGVAAAVPRPGMPAYLHPNPKAEARRIAFATQRGVR
jgi:archaellum component FlaC